MCVLVKGSQNRNIVNLDKLINKEFEPPQRLHSTWFIELNTLSSLPVWVGSRCEFELDFTIEPKQIEGLMVNRNCCQQVPSLNKVNHQ